MNWQKLFIDALFFLTVIGFLPGFAFAEDDALSLGRRIKQRRYPLRATRASKNVVQSFGWWELAREHLQRDGEPISIEAESSTRVVVYGSDAAPVENGEASGGYCIKDVTELENRLIIEHDGKYRAWYRAFFPLKGNWGHSEQMDDGRPQWVIDSFHGPDQKWLWVKGPVYSLDKGAHTYLFPAPTAWCGGALLDKIVLKPENGDEPIGMGPPVSMSRIAPQGELISNRFRLDEMLAWQLAYEKEDNAGKIELEYSYDCGKTWKKLPDGEVLETTPGVKRVTFRITLVAGPEGTSPRIRDLMLVGSYRSELDD